MCRIMIKIKIFHKRELTTEPKGFKDIIMGRINEDNQKKGKYTLLEVDAGEIFGLKQWKTDKRYNEQAKENPHENERGGNGGNRDEHQKSNQVPISEGIK